MIVLIDGKEEQRELDRFEVDDFNIDSVPKAIPKLRHGEEIFETLDGTIVVINTYEG